MKDTTRLVRVGLPEPPEKVAAGDPIDPGPIFASAYATPGDPAESAYTYARFQNPTWGELEHALGTLEGGIARIFPSGMAAVMAVFAAILRPGDTIVLPSDCYYTTRI